MFEWFAGAWGVMSEVWGYVLVSIEGTELTVGRLVTATLLIILSVFLSKRTSRLLGRSILPRMGVSEGAVGAFESLSFYLLLALFSLIALRLAGVPYSMFAILGGALAIGVGFGSQNIVNNFISGVIMMVEQPVKQGDLVEVEGNYGTVEHIGPRSSRVRTPSNMHVVVPNSFFLERVINNWTLADKTVRTDVAVGVAYGSDVELVRQLLRQTAEDHSDVLKVPEPSVLFTDFGDNALQFELLFWVRMQSMMDRRKVQSELRFAVDRSFRKHGVVIAFPQSDVHFDTARPIEVRMVSEAPASRAHSGRTKES